MQFSKASKVNFFKVIYFQQEIVTNFAKRNEVAKTEFKKIILWALTELLLFLIVKIPPSTVNRHWTEQPR